MKNSKFTIMLILASLSCGILNGQTKYISIEFWKNGDKCICQDLEVRLASEHNDVTFSGQGGFYFSDPISFAGKGNIVVEAGGVILSFMNLNLNVSGGQKWKIHVDYRPFEDSNKEFIKIKDAKWLYSLEPGNGAIITEYRTTIGRRFKCRKA